MRILGIDPGTVVVGYGVIDSQGDKMTLIDYNALTCRQRSPIGERLSYIYNQLSQVIARYQPDVVAVEQPFVAKNVRTALMIGKAQAAAILAAANRGIPTYEYTPAQIKRVVTNYGASSKEQVQEMVRLQLGMAEVPQPNDAADALAVAICHLRQTHLENLLAERGQ
ncbi:MAG: crossover junction endodeoxyribonuclease RuvC [Dehalococcoidales bacterium]